MADNHVNIKISATNEVSGAVNEARSSLASLAKETKQAKKDRRATGETALGKMMSSPEGMVDFAMDKAGIGLAAMVIDQVGKALAAATAKMVEFADRMHEGTANTADFTLETMKGIPIIGGFAATGENINEMFTHTKRDAKAAAQAVADMTTATAAYLKMDRDSKGTGLRGKEAEVFAAKNKLADINKDIAEKRLTLTNDIAKSTDPQQRAALQAVLDRSNQVAKNAKIASEIEIARIEAEWDQKRFQERAARVQSFAAQEAEIAVAALNRKGQKVEANEQAAKAAFDNAEKTRIATLEADKHKYKQEGRESEIPELEEASLKQKIINEDKYAEQQLLNRQNAVRQSAELGRQAAAAATEAEDAEYANRLHSQNEFFEEQLANIQTGALKQQKEIDAQAEIAARDDEDNRAAIMAKAEADKKKVQAGAAAQEAEARKQHGLKGVDLARAAAEAQANADGEAKETALKKQGQTYLAESSRIERERAAKLKAIKDNETKELATADAAHREVIRAKAKAEAQKTNQDADEAMRQLLMGQVGTRGASVTAGAVSGRFGTGFEASAKNTQDPVRDLVKFLKDQGGVANDFYKAMLAYFQNTPTARPLTGRGG